MNELIFRKIMSKFDVPDYYYGLGCEKDDASCVLYSEESRRWEVFYSERGQRKQFLTFSNESDALCYLCGLIIGSVYRERSYT